MHSVESKRAMFWAALATHCANEPWISTNRVVAALLRSPSVVDFCGDVLIDTALLREAVEDPHALSYEECERRVRADLVRRGLELGSPEHIAAFHPPSLDASLRPLIDAVMARYGSMGASPLKLLLDILSTDRSLAERLAPYGLTADAIRATLGEPSA